MSGQIEPNEAEQALAEIERRHGQIVSQLHIPWWYWSVIAVLMVALAVAVDLRRPWVTGVVVPVFVLGMLLVNSRLVLASWRAQPRRDLVDPIGVFAILGFVALVVGVSLGIALPLKFSGVAYPATWGIVPGAVLMAVGGPRLNRFLRQRMMLNRAGSR